MRNGQSDLDRWEERFAAPDYLFGTEPNAFLKREAHRLQHGQNVLAVADGEGRNGVWLAEQGLKVLSVDFSPRALAKAQALAAERRVALRTQKVDLSAWSWPENSFDAVVAIFIQFATAAVRPHIFGGITRALKPGGLLLMEGYRPEQLDYRTGGPPQVEHLYTRELLKASFAGFSSLDIREHDSVIHEGAGHDGLSALIDLIGVK